jgi:hypothetical protein
MVSVTGWRDGVANLDALPSPVRSQKLQKKRASGWEA